MRCIEARQMFGDRVPAALRSPRDCAQLTAVSAGGSRKQEAGSRKQAHVDEDVVGDEVGGAALAQQLLEHVQRQVQLPRLDAHCAPRKVSFVRVPMSEFV